MAKNMFFKEVSYPLIYWQISKNCFLWHFFHVCAVENASEKVKPFSFTSSGLSHQKPGPCEEIMKPEPKLSLGDICKLA